MRARGSKTRVAGLAGLVAAFAVCAATASADWSGVTKADVLAIGSGGALLQYRGTGAGGFVPNSGEAIGSGWGSFTALLATEFSGDGRQDLLARTTDGLLLMYRGNGRGGFVTGTGESLGGGWGGFVALVAPGDFSGDSRPDVLAVQSNGTLLMYRGNGDSGFIGGGIPIGSGWQNFTALLGPGDWSGDGEPDLLARAADGSLLLYRGNGHGGFIGGGQRVGTGWGGFTALTARGDFSGDGKPDILARQSDGALLMYGGNGATGFFPGAPQVGSGWQSLTFITLIGQDPRAPAPPPPPPAPPSAPLPDGRVKLNAGVRCTPPAGRLRVSLKIRKRRGHPRPKVVRVVFFVRNGPRRVDRRKPYAARLRLRRPAGSKGRVYARVFFRRPGTRKLRRKTVARRFVMCG